MLLGVKSPVDESVNGALPMALPESPSSIVPYVVSVLTPSSSQVSESKSKSKPLIWIVKYISPAGNLACVHIDDLVVCIVKECLAIKIANDDQIYNCIKNCSRKIKIHDLITNILGVKPIINLKYIPIDLINLIFLFFPKNFRMKLLVYLIDIEYFNNYDFLNERPISDYF